MIEKSHEIPPPTISPDLFKFHALRQQAKTGDIHQNLRGTFFHFTEPYNSYNSCTAIKIYRLYFLSLQLESDIDYQALLSSMELVKSWSKLTSV